MAFDKGASTVATFRLVSPSPPYHVTYVFAYIAFMGATHLHSFLPSGRSNTRVYEVYPILHGLH